MKVRIEESTLNSLVELAEQAVAADAHDQGTIASLQASMADEKDLPQETADRINKLTAPATDATPKTEGAAGATGTVSGTGTAAPTGPTSDADKS